MFLANVDTVGLVELDKSCGENKYGNVTGRLLHDKVLINYAHIGETLAAFTIDVEYETEIMMIILIQYKCDVLR